MSWLKNLLRGKEDRGRTCSLRLSDIDAWLEERCQDPVFEKSLQEIYRRIEEVSRDFINDTEALRAAAADEEAPPKLLRAGQAARGEIVKQLASLAERLEPPRQRDIEAASAHHWALVKGLERTVTIFGRAQRYVAALFPKEAERINSDLTRISRLLVDLEKEIGRRRSVTEEIWYIRELHAGIQRDLAQISALEASTKGAEGSLKGLRDSVSRRESELRRLASSDEGRRADDLSKRLDQMRQELNSVDDEMAGLIAPLTKALNRIAKQGATERLSLQRKDVLERLCIAPSQVPKEDISSALIELRSHMAALGLKDKKREKILEHLDHLIKNNALEALRSRSTDLQEEIGILEQKLSESSQGSRLLRDELKLSQREIRDIEAALEKGRRDLSVLREKVSGEEAELKARLGRLAGEPVEIETENTEHKSPGKGETAG
ncbi:MAG: hypothetical protein A4E48_02118 [Methanosaeta sp. PtaU1.Bin060]|nr:MAG: hypothetical protein A4E48_02118 [Methanosaeta sp. PtaU1.Bin060]